VATYTFPGGAETITRLGDKYVWLYSPSRSVVVGGREMTKEEEARWRDEEEVLNEARRLRLAGWREELQQSDQEVPAAARAADKGTQQDGRPRPHKESWATVVLPLLRAVGDAWGSLQASSTNGMPKGSLWLPR
jgi:hypothetical protein